MTAVESTVWCSYVTVVREFQGNTKASNYQNLVDLMLRNFQALGARMSVKLHYLFSHLDFPENLGDEGEEQGGAVPPRYQDNGKKIPMGVCLWGSNYGSMVQSDSWLYSCHLRT